MMKRGIWRTVRAWRQRRRLPRRGTRNRSKDGESGAAADGGLGVRRYNFLIRPDALHVELALYLTPVGQRGVDEHDPVARHREFEGGVVSPRPVLFRLG